MSYTQFFPALDAATESALRESIRRFGVVHPVVVDQHGRIIDGHHRSRIAGEEGVEVPVAMREVADDDELREFARSLNLDRRHMPAGQRREIVAALRAEGHSLRAIAGAVGVHHTQVRKDLAGVDQSTPGARRGGRCVRPSAFISGLLARGAVLLTGCARLNRFETSWGLTWAR